MITDALLHIFKKDQTVKRDILKTISWRLVGSVDTAILGWLITGRLSIGLKIGAAELATKMVLYFMHERVWHRIRFGTPSRYKIAQKVRKANRPNLFKQPGKIDSLQRQQGTPAFTIWLTGLSGSGKSTLAAELEAWLFNNNVRTYVLDGDNTRLGINSDLSFSKEDRSENIRRVAEICKLMNEAGTTVIASFISPFERDRQMAKSIIGTENFTLVHVDADIETCKQRDTKGLYKLALAGKLKEFTGIDSPYEIPHETDIRICTDHAKISSSLSALTNHLIKMDRVKQPDLTLAD